MFITILIAVLLLVGLGLFIFGKPRAWGAIPVVFALIIMAFACTTIVQAKDVGVLTTFGKPDERALNPGLHLKGPWQSVTELDGTVKTDEYRGSDCIQVRIGDGSQSCVTVAHRWQIVPERAGDIYGSFRSDDPTQSLRDAVVSTQLKAVTQDVLAKYNPVANLQVVPGAKAQGASLNFAPDYDQISRDITAGMEDRYGANPLVKTVAITVSYVSLSESTQSKINSFIAEVANTRIAAQKKETATNEAAANEALSASISHDPNVLVSKCFDIVAEAAKNKYEFNAGFSCWNGSGAVVVPSK